MKNKNINPIELGIYTIIILHLAITGLNNSMFYITHLDSIIIMGKASVMLRLLLVILAILNYSKKKIKRDEFIFLAIYALLVASNYLISKGWVLFDSFFIAIVFGHQLDYKKTLKVFFYTILATTVITILCYYLGLFPEYTFMRTDGIVRNSLGFNHPNTLGKTVMCLTMLFLLMHERPLGIKSVIALLAVSFWIYKVPNSLTSSMVIIATMIAKLIIDRKLWKRINKKICLAIIFSSPIFIMAVIYAMVKTGIGVSLVHSISETFSSRFIYGSQALNNYGISLFGQSVVFANELTINYFKTATTYFTIDCFYIYMPVVVGLIPSLFFLYYYINCMKKAMVDHNSTMLAILFALLIYCIMESALMLFMFDFIFIGTLAYNKNKIIKGGEI